MARCVNVHKRSIDVVRGVLEGHPTLYAKVGIHYGVCGTALKGGGFCPYTSNKSHRATCVQCGALPPPGVMVEQASVQRETKEAGKYVFGQAPYRKQVPAPDLVGGQGSGKGNGKGQGGNGKGYVKGDRKGKGNVKTDSKGKGHGKHQSDDAALLRKAMERIDLLEKQSNGKGGK